MLFNYMINFVQKFLTHNNRKLSNSKISYKLNSYILNKTQVYIYIYKLLNYNNIN